MTQGSSIYLLGISSRIKLHVRNIYIYGQYLTTLQFL